MGGGPLGCEKFVGKKVFVIPLLKATGEEGGAERTKQKKQKSILREQKKKGEEREDSGEKQEILEWRGSHRK